MLTAKTIDIESILPVCVKFCASHNSKVKKSACEALICCSERFSRPDVGLLAVNILMKDLNDPNPEVRATAIDTISSLSLLADEHSLPGMYIFWFKKSIYSLDIGFCQFFRTIFS